MAIIKSFASYQNLSNFGTFINDESRTSEYFRITEFKDTFTGGKNGFLIEGSEHLRETTEIKIEILDVAGTPVYYEPGNGIPEYYEGISKIVSVHIYEDTPIGLGKITILGELKTYIDENGVVRDVPVEWRGVYNVKWERTFNINKNLGNETIVRFYKRPKITIDEIVKPIYDVTTPFITQSGSVVGISQVPISGVDLSRWTAGTLYKLKRVSGPEWTSSIDENIIELPNLGYSATIKEVLNSDEILVDTPYTINNIVTNFTESSYTSSFEYLAGQTFTESALTGSFAKIQISNLKTFVGDVARVKVFRKSRNDVGDYVLVQESKLESAELLRDLTAAGQTDISYGNFTQTNLDTYWTGSTNLLPTINLDKLYASVKPSNGPTGVQTLYTSQSVSVAKDVEYTLTFKTLYSGSVDNSKSLRAYLSSSGYTQEFLTLSGSAVYQTKQDITQNIIAIPTSSLADAKLVFEFNGSGWHVSNVSLKNAQETSFSPDEFTIVQDVAKNVASETFDFRFEFYDINNNYIPVDVFATKTFTGGNNFLSSTKLLTFDSDRNSFRFATGSIGNPIFQTIGFTVSKQNLVGPVTYGRSVFDLTGSYIDPIIYTGVGAIYPGEPTNPNENGFIAHIDEFTGSLQNIVVGSITYTASCDGLHQHETVYRLEDGENSPGLFASSTANQFIYKATDLLLNPSNQVITFDVRRKNLGISGAPITINSGSEFGIASPLIPLFDDPSTGVATYYLSGSTFNYTSGSATYFFSASDTYDVDYHDTVRITPIKILDGFSVITSNDNTSFPASSIGSVIGGFAASSGSITVKVGSEVINYSSAFIPNSFSASISSTAGLTPNTFNGTNYSINALSQDSGSLTLLVKYKDGGGTIISSSKEITYSKVKKAAPVLEFVIGNNNQSTDSTSIGTQITAFANSSLSVKEQYNGVTSTLTLANAPTINSSSAFTPITKTTTNLAYPNMVTGTDSVELSITGSAIDSEGVSRNVFGNVSLTKIKKAAPVLAISSTPKDQSVTAKSTGAQIDSFANATIVVNQTYNGVTTPLSATLTATRVDTGGSLTVNNTTGVVTLSNQTLATGTNSTTINISAVVTDSEGTIRTLTDTLSLSKVKKAVPLVLISASPQAQSVLANSAGTQTGTLANVTISALEGTTSRFTSMAATYSGFSTNPTISSATLTMTSAVMNASEASATIIVTHTDSEDTTGQTQTIVVRFTKVVNGSNGTNGTNGDPGAVGGDGPGVVFRGPWSSTTTYNSISQDPTRKDVVLYSGTYYATKANASANLNKQPNTQTTFWQSLGTDSFFVAAEMFISKESYVQNTINVGTNGSGNANITIAGGSTSPYISIGQATKGYNNVGAFLGSDGTNGKLSLKSATNSLLWDGSGLTINGSGTFTGELSGGTINIGGDDATSFHVDSAGQMWLGAGNSGFAAAPFRVTAAGALFAASANITGAITGGTITGTSINGGSITGGSITGGSITGATITAGAGVIGGWTINQTTLSSNSNSIKLNPSATTPGLEIYDTSNVLRVLVSNKAALTDFLIGNAAVSVSGQNQQTYSSHILSDNEPNASSIYLTLPAPLYNLTSLPAAAVTTAGVYNLEIVISQSQLAAASAYLTEAYYGYTSTTINYANIQVTAGVSVRAGSSTGTEVANFGTTFGGVESNNSTSYSRNIGVYGGNGSGTTRTFSGTFTAAASTTYYFVPYISSAFGVVARDYSGGNNLSAFSLYIQFNTPKIDTVALSQDDNRLEMVPGGFQVVASTAKYMKVARQSANETFVIIGGGLTATGNITAYASSDKRLKENIIPIDNALEKIEKLDGVEFDWTNEYIQRESNGKGEDDYFFRKHDVGLIAQQVESILPEVVATRDDGYLAIKYEKIVPLLVECIKELKKEINELKENK